MRLSSSLAALSLAFFVCTAAHAEDKSAVEQAKGILIEADKLFDTKDFEHARLKYATAYGLVPSVDILWALSVSEFESGHMPDAARRFRQYMRDPKARPSRKEEVRSKYLPAAIQQTAQIEVEASPGAAIYLDESFHVGNAPLIDPVDVSPGKHVLEARLKDKATATLELDVTAGANVRIKLVPGQVPAPPIALHVQPIPTGPSDPSEASEWRPRSMVPRNVTVGAVGGAAAVTLGFGVVFSLVSNGKADRVEELRGQTTTGCDPQNLTALCIERAQAVRSQNDYATLSYAFYIAGGVLAAGALVTFLVWPKYTHVGPMRNAYLAPMIGKESSGFTLGASF